MMINYIVQLISIELKHLNITHSKFYKMEDSIETLSLIRTSNLSPACKLLLHVVIGSRKAPR